MAKFIFGMGQSLDGYIAATSRGPEDFMPGPRLFRHFLEQVSGVDGMLYGTQLYEVMRYWDVDHPEWDEIEREFAAAWRPKPKWVVSHSLKTVGPNATLVTGDLETFATRLKADIDGEIDVAGAKLAASLSALGLIDEYRLYFRPLVFAGGKPYFAAVPPPLRLVSTDLVGEDCARIICVPA